MDNENILVSTSSTLEYEMLDNCDPQRKLTFTTVVVSGRLQSIIAMRIV